MKILHVVGTRPNFVKAAPVMRALDGRAEQILVHTGQHYDAEMSAAFFDDLDLPRPDVDLEVGSGPPGEQTARIMSRLEPMLDRHGVDACVVYGDVTSTLAAALVAAQRRVPVAHVEAGLRSRDRTMPEETRCPDCCRAPTRTRRSGGWDCRPASAISWSPCTARRPSTRIACWRASSALSGGS